MNTQVEEETYNPWSVVNLVFRHLASEGLHPVLGETGDPGAAGRRLAPRARHHARQRRQPAGLRADR